MLFVQQFYFPCIISATQIQDQRLRIVLLREKRRTERELERDAKGAHELSSFGQLYERLAGRAVTPRFAGGKPTTQAAGPGNFSLDQQQKATTAPLEPSHLV